MLTADVNVFTPQTLTWLEAILHERFGHHFSLTQHDKQLTMRLSDAAGAVLFDALIPAFHQPGSDAPCSQWDAASQGYTAALGLPLPAPGVATLPAQLIEPTALGHVVHYDILGLSYWMLARLEEVNPPASVLDNHGRFPATASHAFKHGYLERPVVDEWLHILGQVVQKTWPTLQLARHQFSMKVSHDVDIPSRYAFRSAAGIMRAMAGDLLNRGDLKSALLAPWVRLHSETALHPADPANTFDWIMDMSERHGLKSAFYFICGRTDPTKDADYEPEHPAIRTLMRRIHARGHEIGLHPSYGSYQTPSIIRQEANRLRQIAGEEGIEQAEWGGRMHYLRWEYPTTLRAWVNSGMTYDSTLGYPETPGFRCGTCTEYQAFDPIAQQAFNLRLRPLVAMDVSVIADEYLGMGRSLEALTVFKRMIDACKAVNGTFSLLWHNSQLLTLADKDLFCSTLDEACPALPKRGMSRALTSTAE